MVDTLVPSDQDIDAEPGEPVQARPRLVADGRRPRRVAGDLLDGRAQRGASGYGAWRRRRPRPSSPGSSTATPWCSLACCCPRARSATDTGGAAHCSSAWRSSGSPRIAPVFLDSPVQIIIARAVAGVGAAFIMPATLSLLTAAYPKTERNKAVGIWAGVASSGAVVGFLGTGILLHHFSWQSIFYAFAAAALYCSCSPARFGRRATRPPHRWTGWARCSSAPPSRCSCSA